jgi:hypothetical protein
VISLLSRDWRRRCSTFEEGSALVSDQEIVHVRRMILFLSEDVLEHDLGRWIVVVTGSGFDG